MDKKKTQYSPIILRGNINEIGFEYEIKSKKDHKIALKDLKALAGKLEKEVKDGSPIYKKINRYKIQTEELRKQTIQLERQLKYTKRLSLITMLEKLIYEQIKNYKDWEIEKVITDEILNNNRYGGQLRRLINEEVDKAVAEKITPPSVGSKKELP